jgi:hypothetical protein
MLNSIPFLRSGECAVNRSPAVRPDPKERLINAFGFADVAA